MIARAPFAARAVRLGSSFDLLAAYEPDGGFYLEREGSGVSAASMPGSPGWATAGGEDLQGLGNRVLETLRSIPAPADGPSPVAVGALAFWQEGRATLDIPSRVVRRTVAGETWLVDLRPPGEAESLPAFEQRRGAQTLPHDAFRAVQLRETPSPGAYAGAVAGLMDRIRAGELSKVVLARTLEVDAGRPLDAARLVHRLRAVDPHCYVFAARTGMGTSLVGASPELLVSRRGLDVRSSPLAGSAPRSGDPQEDRANGEALRDSTKNRQEHAIVVEAVAEALGPFCERLDWDPEPVLLATANVWHLCTRFRGVLRDPAVSALDLVAALHPTPAICGSPREAARATISELEPFDRGCYGGPVGWMDADGDGEWAIALRCAELRGDHATLYAGAGIVAASDPASEVDETDRKFRAFLDSLRWG